MTNTHTFRPIGRISKWLINWSIASIALTVIYVVSAFILLYLFVDVYHAPNSFTFWVAQVMLVIHIVSGIMTLFWFYRANKNIHAFGAKEVTSPAMSVIWWFIPIAFFWKPYSVAQQIWKASNPEVKLIEGTESRKVPESNIVRVWWILGILAILLRVLADVLFIPAFGQSLFTPHYIEEPNVLYKGFPILIMDIPAMISTVYFIRMIKKVSEWQGHKAGAKS
ncbi:MAG TPA: DUF4328 domain-containing protein [Nitrososphaeraceae archaeon]